MNWLDRGLLSKRGATIKYGPMASFWNPQREKNPVCNLMITQIDFSLSISQTMNLSLKTSGWKTSSNLGHIREVEALKFQLIQQCANKKCLYTHWKRKASKDSKPSNLHMSRKASWAPVPALVIFLFCPPQGQMGMGTMFKIQGSLTRLCLFVFLQPCILKPSCSQSARQLLAFLQSRCAHTLAHRLTECICNYLGNSITYIVCPNSLQSTLLLLEIT